MDKDYCRTGVIVTTGSEGTLSELRLDCSFATEHDTVTIYSNRTLDSGRPWQEQIDTERAVWVFERGTPKQAALIIEFQTDGATRIANLYEDINGDGVVAYTRNEWAIEITETNYWSVQIRTQGSWWQLDRQRPNMNLSVLVDGPVYAVFGSEPVLRFLQRDGKPDVSMQIFDENKDGRPDWQWIDFWPDANPLWAVYRTMLMVNVAGTEPLITSRFPWPYLGTAFERLDADYITGKQKAGPAHPLVGPEQQLYGIIQGYNQRFAPLQIHWSTARLAFVGEFVASRGGETNWFLYSVERITPGTLTDADFEAPFGFYDLANDGDGLPELQVRLETDLPAKLPGLLEPNAAVRYSWDQDNNGEWDYKLDMRVDLELQPVSRGSLQFRIVPYERLPALVHQDSGLVAFVANEGREAALQGPLAGRREFMMEGIYDWTTVPARDYVAGMSNLPGERFQNVARGERAELRSTSSGPPKLYLSGVDGLLHLKGADYGIWTLENGLEVRYADLDKDGYIDHWTRNDARAGTEQTIQESLYNLDNYLVFASRQEVRLRAQNIASALFETAPPEQHTNWRRLSKLLEENQKAVSASDPRALFASFMGPELVIQNSSILDLRTLAPAGFRFVLNLQPGFKVYGEDKLGLSNLTPGSYIIKHDGDAFTIEEFEDVQMSLTLLHKPGAVPVVQQPHPMKVGVQNAGNSDVRRLTLAVKARQGERAVDVLREPIEVLSGLTTETNLSWYPPTAGDWDLTVELSTAEGVIIAQQQQSIEVVPQPGASSVQITANSSRRLHFFPLSIILAGIAVAFGTILHKILL